MKQWWRGLQMRERIVVAIAGVLMLLLGFHSLVWEPWQQAGADLADGIEQAEDDLNWMREAVTRLPQAGKATVAVAARGNLVTRMNRLISQAGLRQQMKQMKPAAEKEVRLRFEKAGFDPLLKLLGQIQSQGLEIRELRILPAEEPGRVNATLVVRGG